MTASSDAKLHWEEQQRSDQAQRKLVNRQWLKDFTLALVLIVITVTVATALARWGASGK